MARGRPSSPTTPGWRATPPVASSTRATYDHPVDVADAVVPDEAASPPPPPPPPALLASAPVRPSYSTTRPPSRSGTWLSSGDPSKSSSARATVSVLAGRPATGGTELARDADVAADATDRAERADAGAPIDA